MRKLSRKELRKLIKEEQGFLDRMSQGFETAKSYISDPSGEAKKYLTNHLIENASKYAEDWFPIGTQTLAEKGIKLKAKDIANCIVDLVNPF